MDGTEKAMNDKIQIFMQSIGLLVAASGSFLKILSVMIWALGNIGKWLINSAMSLMKKIGEILSWLFPSICGNDAFVEKKKMKMPNTNELVQKVKKHSKELQKKTKTKTKKTKTKTKKTKTKTKTK